jgi:hypothetical protein
MSSSRSDTPHPQARKVRTTNDDLVVELVDGRSVTVPLQWYPRLAHSSAAHRRKWCLIGRGEGIHWREIDEDIRVEDLLAGRPSSESRASFSRWLKGRQSSVRQRVEPESKRRAASPRKKRVARAAAGIRRSRVPR